MKAEDLKIGGLYRNITNNFVFIVKDVIKAIDGNTYLKWSARNRKGLESRNFKDNISKINFNFIVEEKDFEKYD